MRGGLDAVRRLRWTQVSANRQEQKKEGELSVRQCPPFSSRATALAPAYPGQER